MRRLLALGAVALGATLGLSACSQQSGLNLARQACVHVNSSLHDYALSLRPGTSAAVVVDLQNQANAELRAALPLAAAATSDDGSWNSLMTTLSESAWVDEPHLIPALRAQCIAADTNPNVNPQNPEAPGTTPQNVNPQGSPGS
ncbi:MAG: hypothetical protein ACLPVF_19150 [Acidimicrobiales bacterium]